jgi:hypothetical protein
MEEIKNVAMQERCIHCGREQYGPAVYMISYGKHPCVWCGKMSKQLTEQEYFEKLHEPQQG